MQLVAIAELTGAFEAAIRPLAESLGTTAYELKLVLNAGLPAVVLATVDPARAASAVSTIRRAGHVAVSCDRAECTPSAQMTPLRDFRLDADGIQPNADSSAHLPYARIGAMLRATHRRTIETTQKVEERKLRPGMAVLTGGLVMSKKTSREVTTQTHERDQVLYLFRADGQPAWILRERQAHYSGLGDSLRPTSLENFQTTVRMLRERSPSAAYDERLMSGRPIRGVADGSDATDLLAHLLARHLCR
jgi:hypothetical protein